jgi:hypothetical protein
MTDSFASSIRNFTQGAEMRSKKKRIALAIVAATPLLMAAPVDAAFTTTQSCATVFSTTDVTVSGTWTDSDTDPTKVEIRSSLEPDSPRLATYRLSRADKVANTYSVTLTVSGARDAVGVRVYFGRSYYDARLVVCSGASLF